MCQAIEVSVIVPVYNTEKYLHKCINSLLKQTLKNIEVICVDDGSTDASLEILTKYANEDTRVKIIKQNNMGAGAARNVGMQNAQGKYLYFMDSDDYCSLDFLEKAVEEAERKNTDILVFNFCKFDEQTGKKEYRDGLVRSRCPKDKDVFSYKDIPNVICKVVNPTPWNKLYKHTFVKEHNLEWLEVSTTNDITFATVSVLAAERIAYLDETFLFYRVNLSNSITSKKKYCQDNVIKAVLSVDKQAKSFDYYEELKNSIREFIVSNLLSALKNYTPDEASIYHIEFKKKIQSIFLSYPLFLNPEKYKFHDAQIYSQMLEYRSGAMERQDFSFAPKIIVSLTTFPQRINTVHIAVASIFQQTKKPDKVILWLAESQFPNKEADLPVELLDYMNFGLEIRWCEEDLRPHKKYFYVMQEFPEDIVITIDDDLTYDVRMIEKLFVSYLHYPNAVSTVRTHLIKANEAGKIASYSRWIKEYSGLIGVPSLQLFSTSGAGTLYPPHCMDEEIFNINNIKELCLNADDLWLKIMQVKKGTKVVLVDKNQLLKYIPETQETALRDNNLYHDGNDIQLNKILSAYDKDNICEKSILSENIDEKAPNIIVDLKKTNKYGLFQNESVLIETQERLERVKGELAAVRKTKSYRIGMAMTYIPRKFIILKRYYKENGFKGTICRIKEKIMRVSK